AVGPNRSCGDSVDVDALEVRDLYLAGLLGADRRVDLDANLVMDLGADPGAADGVLDADGPEKNLRVGRWVLQGLGQGQVLRRNGRPLGARGRGAWRAGEDQG